MITHDRIDVGAISPELIDRLLAHAPIVSTCVMLRAMNWAMSNANAIKHDDDLKTIAEVKLLLCVCGVVERMQTTSEDIGDWHNGMAREWLPVNDQYNKRFTEWMKSRNYSLD